MGFGKAKGSGAGSSADSARKGPDTASLDKRGKQGQAFLDEFEGSDGDEEHLAADGDESDDDARLLREADAASDEDMGFEVLSPFGPEVFSTAAACWAHADKVHGFSLQRLRDDLAGSWSDYHRIRLVNFLRAMGPDEARRRAAEFSTESLAGLWEDDALLAPVLGDDVLLFEAEEGDWCSGEADEAVAAEACGGGGGGTSSSGGGAGAGEDAAAAVTAVTESPQEEVPEPTSAP